MDARSCTCLCWPWAPLRAAWQHKAAHGRPRTQLGGRTHHGQSLGVIVRSWDVHHLSFIIFFSNRVFSTSFPNSPASAVTIEASLYQTSVFFPLVFGVSRFCGQELPVPSRAPRRPEAPGRFGVLTGGDRLVRQLQGSLVPWPGFGGEKRWGKRGFWAKKRRLLFFVGMKSLIFYGFWGGFRYMWVKNNRPLGTFWGGLMDGCVF